MVETLASGQGSGGRGWFLARIVPLVVMSVGTGVYANGWTTGRPTALRLGGALIALAGVLCVPAALFARRIARLARHEGLVAVAVGAQTVFLAHHLVQFAQMRRFNLPLPFVVGVSSRLNAEWLSVVWLWLACAALVAAYRGGNRSRLLFVAAAWTLLHSLEHLYLLIQFARVTAALDNFGLARPRAIEMLPGVVPLPVVVNQAVEVLAV